MPDINFGQIALTSFFTALLQWQARKSARRLREKAEEEADLRKGFQVAVKGAATDLPIIYGRGKVAATIVDLKVADNYTYAAAGSTGTTWDTDSLSENITGKKNEFLTVQYAICQGPVESIRNIDVDGQPYNAPGFFYGQRIVSYPSGGTADPLASANGYLTTDKFTKCAFATGVYRLNKDEPQYNAAPVLDFYVFGLKVPTVNRAGSGTNSDPYTYSVSNTSTYSNNPARVLLHYLTDDIGKGLPTSKIDLESFYNSIVVCDTAVNHSNGLGKIGRFGKIWTILDDDLAGERVNVIRISKTSGSTSITLTKVAGPTFTFTGTTTYSFYFNDDRFSFLGSNVVGSGPTYTVALSNITGVVGSIANTTVIDYRRASYLFALSETAVDTLPVYECNLVLAPSTSIKENIASILGTMGDPTFLWTAGKYKLVVNYPTTQTQENNLVVKTITDDEIINDRISIVYPSQSEKYNQVTARFINEEKNFEDDEVIWPPYSTVDTSPYQTYLSQDGDKPLRNSISLDGVTDVYHATARAEQLVRSSREEIIYEFLMDSSGFLLEPGDIIKLNSTAANVVNKNLLIETATVQDGNLNVRIRARSFSHLNLAWNVADSVAAPIPRFYDFSVPAPTAVTATYNSGDRRVRITWTVPANESSAVNDYIVQTKLDSEAETQWRQISTTSNKLADHHPGPSAASYVYRVIARTATGIRSDPSDPSSAVSVPASVTDNNNIVVGFDQMNVIYVQSGDTFSSVDNVYKLDVRQGATLLTRVADDTADDDLENNEWKYVSKTETGTFDVALTAFSSGSNFIESTISNFSEAGTVEYSIKVKISGTVSTYERSISVITVSDGLTGQPASGHSFSYSNLETSTPTTNGEYAFYDSTNSRYCLHWAQGSGRDITADTNQIIFNQAPRRAGVNDAARGYFPYLEIGDRIIYEPSTNQWVSFIVTSTAVANSVTNPNYYTIGVSIEEFTEGTNPSTGSGTDVWFRFSRPYPNPPLEGAAHTIVYDNLEASAPNAVGEYAYQRLQDGSLIFTGTTGWANIRYNNTRLYLYENTTEVAAYLGTLQTNDYVTVVWAPSKWVKYRVTGSVTDGGSYRVIPITTVEANDYLNRDDPSLQDSQNVDVQFSRAVAPEVPVTGYASESYFQWLKRDPNGNVVYHPSDTSFTSTVTFVQGGATVGSGTATITRSGDNVSISYSNTSNTSASGGASGSSSTLTVTHTGSGAVVTIQARLFDLT